MTGAGIKNTIGQEDNELVMFEPNLIPLINPNPGMPDYVISLNHQLWEVPPMKVFRVPKARAIQILQKAISTTEQMKNQAAEERKAFVEYHYSANPSLRDQAKKFGRLDDKQQVVTTTQAPKRPWIVRLDEPEGKKFYQEALDELENIKVEDAPLEDFEVETELDFGDAAFTQDQPENPNAPQVINLEKPKLEWGKSKLRFYVEQNGGLVAAADDESKLLRKALKLIGAKERWAKEAGLQVVVKE